MNGIIRELMMTLKEPGGEEADGDSVDSLICACGSPMLMRFLFVSPKRTPIIDFGR